MTMASMSQLTLSEPFRFLDLPGEIRNRVYKIILCTTQLPEPNTSGLYDVPTELTKLRHSIEPQILRTCRQIYAEANYVMWKTNLLVKLIVKIPFDELRPLLVQKRLPVLKLHRKRVKNLKGVVMSHEITDPGPIQAKSSFLLFLHRDLHRFCQVLIEGKWSIPRHDELVTHIVTLVDPYESTNSPDTPTFYSRKLQEMLIAPYRPALREFPRFQIKGAVPTDLAREAVSEITRRQPKSPDSILRELEELKLQGNDYFRQGDGTMASERWSQALMKMHRYVKSRVGESVRAAGGEDFVNRITALTFDLNSNRAQNYLKSMRENLGNRELLRGLAEGLFHAINGARGAPDELPGATWEPSYQQVAKLLYREAVGCRLVGEMEYLSQAETAIEVAIRAMPGDAELEREEKRISQWRRRILGEKY